MVVLVLPPWLAINKCFAYLKVQHKPHCQAADGQRQFQTYSKSNGEEPTPLHPPTGIKPCLAVTRGMVHVQRHSNNHGVADLQVHAVSCQVHVSSLPFKTHTHATCRANTGFQTQANMRRIHLVQGALMHMCE